MTAEQIKKDLLTVFEEKMAEEQKIRENAAIKTDELTTLNDFIGTLEESSDNLKQYSREWLENLLVPYYQKSDLEELLDKLEIPLLAISMRTHGISINFNEEEIGILTNFQDDLKSIWNQESRKFEEEVEGGVPAVDKRIADLNTLYSKINAEETGKEVVRTAEIDYVLQLTTQEEATIETQIEILGFINRINLQIYKNR